MIKKIHNGYKLIIAAVVVMLCFTAAGGVYGAADYQKTVAYVPLDNRPVNTQRVQYLVGSVGYTLAMPNEDLYATKLDGQPLNENNTQYGDCEKLCEWLLKQEEAGCDYYVISLDQVLSGGLVNSRSAVWETEDPVEPVESGDEQDNEPEPEPEPEPNPDPEVTWEDVVNNSTEMEYIKNTLAVLAAEEENQIVFIDTVMRLASTVGYNGYGQDMYNALREYGKVERATLEGADLTIDNIIAGYHLDPDGKLCENVLADDKKGDKKKLLTADDSLAINTYLASRSRKLSLIDAVIKEVGKKDNVYYLVGVDDSSPGNTVQTNEIDYITEALGDRGLVFDGADELGMMAFTRLYSNIEGKDTSVYLEFFGGSDDAVGTYETQELRKVIESHVIGVGSVEEVKKDEADIEVLVLTPPKNTNLRYFYAKDLVDAYNENVENQIPTVIVDASEGTYYGAFIQRLIRESELGYLLGYSGWNTWGNATGIGLSQGVCRYLYLTSTEPKEDNAHSEFVRSLTFGLVKDMTYIYKGRDSMSAYIGNYGLSPSNFYTKNLNPVFINEHLANLIENSAEDILANLNSGNIITDLNSYNLKGINSVALSDFSFPWYRTFECIFSVSAPKLTDPNEKDKPTPDPEYIDHKPYIDGYPDDTFRPNNSVARCELTKMISVAENLSLGEYKGVFGDVSDSSWYYSYVEAAADKGYLNGYGDGSFHPEKVMTRGEFASFLVKYAVVHKLEATGEPKEFSDVDPNKWYYQDIADVTALGLVEGYENGTFRPENPVTRGEAVTMLNRVLGRSLEDEGVSLSLISAKNPFSDISTDYWGYLEVLEGAVEHSCLKSQE